MPEKFAVEITRTAESDIEGLWEYLVQEDPAMATRFILDLEEKIGTLERFPERCLPVPENELLGTAYRHYLFGQYRVVYKIRGSRVIILRVVHGARLLDMDSLTDPPG